MASDPRLAALRQALDTAGPEALRASAARLGGATGVWLDALVTAALADDEAALQELLRGAPRDGFDAVTRATLGRVAHAVELAAARAEGALAQASVLPTLRAAAEAAQERVAGDAELAAMIGRAAALLARLEPPLAAAATLPTELRALARALDRSSLAGVQRSVQELERRQRALEDALPALGEVASLAWELATRARGAQGACEVAEAAEAAGLEGPWWQRAMELAGAEGALELARRAGQRAQIVAMAAGRLEEVRAVAARLQAMCEAAGDRRGALLARLEQLLVRARLGDVGPAAREAAQLAEAEEGALRARAWLVAGQVAQLGGHTADARRAWRRVLQGEVEAWPEEAARACLELARSVADADAAQALVWIDRACDIAQQARSPAAFLPAFGARCVMGLDDTTALARLQAARPWLTEAGQWASIEGWLREQRPAEASRWLGVPA